MACRPASKRLLLLSALALGVTAAGYMEIPTRLDALNAVAKQNGDRIAVLEQTRKTLATTRSSR